MNATYIATEGPIKVYRTEDGLYCTHDDKGWMPGKYRSVRGAVEGARQQYINAGISAVADHMERKS